MEKLELAIISYLTGNHSCLKNISSNPGPDLKVACAAHTYMDLGSKSKPAFLSLLSFMDSEHRIVFPERGQFGPPAV